MVEKLHREGQLDDERIRNFAEDGRLEEVRIALSLVSDLPAPFIDQALSQESGEMLLVIAGANGFAWATVDQILHLPIWRRPATEGEIRHCLARYEKLGRTTASDIVQFHKTRLLLSVQLDDGGPMPSQAEISADLRGHGSNP